MRNIKKVLALVLVAVLCLSCFAACSKSGNTDATTAADDKTTVADETTAADKTTAAGEETPAASGTFKIGSIGPLTGKAAIYGQAVMNGAKIAVEEINAKGGIQFEFQAQDDANDAETSVNAYNTLVDWGMQILMGTVTTTPCISVAAESFKDRIFTLTPSASSTDVIDGKDNVFQVCFTDPNQGMASADYISENLTGKKVAIIYRNDDAYSQGIRDTFAAEAKEKNVEIVYEGTFTESTSTDFSAQLTGAQSAGADIVFLPIYYEPASVILKQASDMGYAPTFFGVDGMDGILTLDGFDTKLAEGVMLLTPFSADAEDEASKNFVAKYQEKYKETPNQLAADAYDAIYIIAEAINKAGCTGDMSAAEICEKLIAVMPTITFDGITGAGVPMTWQATGEVSKGPRAVVIENGVYVTPGK